MSGDIKLEIADDDGSCALHKVKVNDMTLTIFQHENGRVTMMVHGMKEAKCDITIHHHKVSKTFVNKKHTWSVIKVVE